MEKNDEINDKDEEKINIPNDYPIPSGYPEDDPVPVKEPNHDPFPGKPKDAPIIEPVKNPSIRVLNLQA